MMIPKPQRKKKRRKHKDSILHCKDGTCYLCIMLDNNYRIHPIVHEHHIYGGPNRARSEAEGLKVYLCLAHHIDGPQAVHNNQNHMRILQEDGQRAFERTHTREEFMELIGRNFLDEEREVPKQKEKVEELGIVFLEPDCNGCFGAAGNDCRFCSKYKSEEEQNDHCNTE